MDTKPQADTLFLIRARIDSGRTKGAPQLNKDIRVLKRAEIEIDSAREQIKKLQSDRDRLRAALEEAREDILSFSNHDWDCKFMLSNFSDTCTCWHQKSIDAIDEALKGQP